MKIILLGPPGSGKGTQSKLLINHYNIQIVSIGDILRSYKENNKLGKKIKEKISIGKLISDQLIIKIVKETFKKNNISKNFLLDGFPRTIDQAIALKEMKIKINYIIELIISDDDIIKRLNGRLIHLPSGRTYHTIYNPPKIKNKDDITGENLIFRDDDQVKVIKNRLVEYYKFHKPITNFYKKEAKLKNIKYCQINADSDIANVNKKIKNFLKKNKDQINNV